MVRRIPLKAFLVLTLFLFTTFLVAETKIYKVVKADGTVVYTDQPPPGSQEFKLKTRANVVPSTAQPKLSPSPSLSVSQPASATATTYDFKITSPSNEQTIRSNEGIVSINASITPSASGIFELVLNGETFAVSSTPQFSLKNLDRGEHNIKINLLDQTGKLLASTPPSRFYLQKVSALLRAN